MKDENKKGEKPKTSKTIAEGIGHKVDYAVKENANIGKEQIREWLVKDIRGSYLLILEVLNSEESIDALVEIFWKRYRRLHDQKNAQPELPLKDAN